MIRLAETKHNQKESSNMRKATRIVATTFGLLAGIAGMGHGITEILQGNIRPAGWMFPSIGSPCVPEQVWHACEPAMTLLPNLLVAGLLTVMLGLLIMVWSVLFIQRRNGGGLLILLSIVLLLAGGGFFPPLIGIVGGLAGTGIHKPLGDKPAGSLLHFSAKLWPWPLVLFVTWLLGQYLVGYFFNDFLKSIMGFALLLIVVLMPLSIHTGYAHDSAA
jgi:hypothetical protein